MESGTRIIINQVVFKSKVVDGYLNRQISEEGKRAQQLKRCNKNNNKDADISPNVNK